jgi:uncharacterized protein (UPF0303 family)
MSHGIEDLEDQERRLHFASFGPEEAWALGCEITKIAEERALPVAIDIRKSGLIMFRATRPGVTPDQDSWVDRKAALVLRMENSGALIAARHKASGTNAMAIGWLDAGYAITGGSFPIRVTGSGVVAAVTASGLSSDADHALVVEGIERFLATQLDQS